MFSSEKIVLIVYFFLDFVQSSHSTSRFESSDSNYAFDSTSQERDRSVIRKLRIGSDVTADRDIASAEKKAM